MSPMLCRTWPFPMILKSLDFFGAAAGALVSWAASALSSPKDSYWRLVTTT
jgi:hypothetical protein